MGRATSIPQRQVILERMKQGHHFQVIAIDLGLNPETVRKLIARFRRLGDDAVTPGYANCGLNPTNRSDPALVEAALALKRQHPGWGAGIIRVLLSERYPERAIPGLRALQRAFARAQLQHARPGRRAGAKRRAAAPHDTWQMDAADQMALAGDASACWLRIVDECSGAVLETAVFPPKVLEYGGRF